VEQVRIEEVLFEIAEALRYPVLTLALAALAWILFEAGLMIAEIIRRRRRNLVTLERAVVDARTALGTENEPAARAALNRIAWSPAMRVALAAIVDQRKLSNASERIAKRLAEFDYYCMRRLERTRILVRFGPALGLMGTLIPLSPALVGLAAGDVETLSENLRVAFSVTVLGLLIGAIAFTISLIRDRLYGQDYSDVEYAASEVLGQGPIAPPPGSTAAAAAKEPKPAGAAAAAATATTAHAPATAPSSSPPSGPSGGPSRPPTAPPSTTGTDPTQPPTTDSPGKEGTSR
jgi:biopolymer transport protein ExbB/TolQ